MATYEVSENVVKATARCPFCGKIKVLHVPYDGFKAWQNGELIQKAFPKMSADDREALKTGICKECWEKVFEDPSWE